MTHYRSHGRNRHLAFEASEQWSCHQGEPISVVFGGFVVLFKRTFRAFRQVCHLGTFAHGEGRRKGKLVRQLRGEKHWKNSVNVHWSPVMALCLLVLGSLWHFFTLWDCWLANALLLSSVLSFPYMSALRKELQWRQGGDMKWFPG